MGRGRRVDGDRCRVLSVLNGRDDEIAEGGDDRDEALKGSCRSDMLNDPLWLSKGDMAAGDMAAGDMAVGDMAVLGPDVQPLLRAMVDLGHDLLLRRA
jgi:hypothetical protein